jgi:hypothetical protein
MLQAKVSPEICYYPNLAARCNCSQFWNSVQVVIVCQVCDKFVGY